MPLVRGDIGSAGIAVEYGFKENTVPRERGSHERREYAVARRVQIRIRGANAHPAVLDHHIVIAAAGGSVQTGIASLCRFLVRWYIARREF